MLNAKLSLPSTLRDILRHLITDKLLRTGAYHKQLCCEGYFKDLSHLISKNKGKNLVS